MTSDIDLRVAELLCSRLCHDLISPVSATLSSIELLGDGGPNRDAVNLMTRSASTASHRLGFYRMAFGFAGNRTATCKLADLRLLAVDYLREGNQRLDWRDEEGDIPKEAARLVFNLILLGKDTLIHGGLLSVRFSRWPESLGVAISAKGRGARLRDDAKATLSENAAIDSLTVRTVQGYYTNKLAEDLGAQLEVTEDLADEVRFAASIPT